MLAARGTGRPGSRASRRSSVTVSQFHRFTPRRSGVGGEPGSREQGVKCKDSYLSQLHRFTAELARLAEFAEVSGLVTSLIWSNFKGPKLRFDQSVYPRGEGGRGGTHFAPYPEHSREVKDEKNGSIPGLKSHFC